MLSVIMLNVITLNVMAPKKRIKRFFYFLPKAVSFVENSFNLIQYLSKGLSVLQNSLRLYQILSDSKLVCFQLSVTFTQVLIFAFKNEAAQVEQLLVLQLKDSLDLQMYTIS